MGDLSLKYINSLGNIFSNSVCDTHTLFCLLTIILIKYFFNKYISL